MLYFSVLELTLSMAYDAQMQINGVLCRLSLMMMNGSSGVIARLPEDAM